MSKATRRSGENGPAAPDIEEKSLSEDEIFEVLSNRRRRYTLHALHQHNDNRAALSTVSREVAACETDKRVPEVDGQERKRVYTSLQQFHLPKMEEKGVVEFDDNEGVIELGDAAEDLDIYLEVTEGRDPPWSVYYLGLAGICAALVVLSQAGVAPLASVPNSAWIAFVLTTLTAFALTHTVLTRNMRLGSEGVPPEKKQ
jgi:DNA-binding transcriptional ArsR family regulator